MAIMNIIKRKIKRLLYQFIRNSKEFAFSKRINFVGNILKFKSNFSYESGLYKVKSEEGEIYICRPQRFNYYINGVKHRLDFLLKEYLLDTIDFGSDDLIIDVGANIGELSLSLIRNFGVNVIAVEPDQVEFQALRHNLPNSVLVNKALWFETSTISFYLANVSGDSSLFKSKESNSKVLIETTTLDVILKNHIKLDKRIKLIKLEAEGAEPEILDGISQENINLVDYISVDVGPERGISNDNTLIEVIDRLSSNFKLIKFGTPRMVALFKNINIE